VSKGLLAPAKEGILFTPRVSLGAKAASIEGLHGERAFKVSRSAVVRGSSSADEVVLVRGPDQVQTHNTLLTPLR